jgi:hypothetical protein
MSGAEESCISSRYQTLSGKSVVRLLNLSPVQDTNIHFELVAMSPEDVTLPTFIALFYTWRGTERPERIYNIDVAANSSLNDSSLNATENLLLTLIQIDEGSLQVRRIYRQAEKVIVWLHSRHLEGTTHESGEWIIAGKSGKEPRRFFKSWLRTFSHTWFLRGLGPPRSRFRSRPRNHYGCTHKTLGRRPGSHPCLF